jgi:hypothetical protein
MLTAAGMRWRPAIRTDYTRRHNMDGRALLPNSWSGRELLVTPLRSAADLVHELCHWLVSAKHRRRSPEFDLGGAPWADVDYPARVLFGTRDDHKQREELQVCMLDVYCHRLLDGAWRHRARDLNLETGLEIKGTWLRFVAIANNDYEASNAELWRAVRRRELDKTVRALVKRTAARSAS